MEQLPPKAQRVTIAIAMMFLPTLGAYGLFRLISSPPSFPPLPIPPSIAMIDPTKWLQLLSWIPPAFACALAGAWVKLIVEPMASWIEKGACPHHWRQIVGAVFFSLLFSVLSYVLISTEAAKMMAELTKASAFGAFVAYFSAAYAAMTGLLDFMVLGVAVTKQRHTGGSAK